MNLSLSWFKSNKVKEELDNLKIERGKLKNDILRKRLEEPSNIAGHIPVEYKEQDQKPYKHVKLVNDVMIVVLNDGQIMTKPSATAADFDRVVNATSYTDILAVISTPEVVKEVERKEEETEKVKALLKGIEVLKGLPDFDVKGNTVYLKGTNRSLPQLLVEEFIQMANSHGQYDTPGLAEAMLNNDKYQALKRFFMWCCLNPRAEVAEKLYEFLTKNSFRITKQGFFVALRNVVSVNGNDNELVQFISNSYNKIKAVWKKRPMDFTVYSSDYFDGYRFIESDRIPGETFQSRNNTVIGNLQELYMDLPNMRENRFTDAYTGTFDIRIGQPVTMDPAKANWSTADCAAAGLHFCQDEIHYVGCGDTSVLVLINPMKIVGIGEHKGRCYEYLPIMTVPREEATEILHDLDFDTLELDEDYVIRELEGLEEKAKKGFVAETTKHEFNLPQMSTAEINNIVLSLKEMEKEISKRVSVIK